LKEDNTKRNEFQKIVRTSLEIVREEGVRSLIRQAAEKIKNREFILREDPYKMWLSNHQLTKETLASMHVEVSRFCYRPKISIVMPAYNTDEQQLTAAINSVTSQVYRNWELCAVDDASTMEEVRKVLAEHARRDPRIVVKYLDEHLSFSGAYNQALKMASGEFVGFLDHDDELTKDALFEVVKVLNDHPDEDLIYSDEDKMDLKGRRIEPFFKPDWSPDLFLSVNYLAHFCVIRRSLLDEIGGFREGFEGSQDYDLILRATEQTKRIFHIPKPLYNWRKVPGSAAISILSKPYAIPAAKLAILDALRRRGVQGDVDDGVFPGLYRVRYRIGSPLVTIIIPTKNQCELLRRCLTSIESKSTYRNYEIIVVDHESDTPEAIDYLSRIKTLPGYTVVKFHGLFNYSRIINLAAKYAKGDHLLLLNNDTEVVTEDWIEAMLEHSQRESVAIVGAKLIFPDGKVQHAGVILGVGGLAGHAFYRQPANMPGYLGLSDVIRNCSAVTAACMMVRRHIFQILKGFDETLEVDLGDVDFCLRAIQLGYQIVYTPYAVLKHYEGASRKVSGTYIPNLNDRRLFTERWGHLLLEGDPYYNPNLSLNSEWSRSFSIHATKAERSLLSS
jgi:GT2 family glycosyltransferase